MFCQESCENLPRANGSVLWFFWTLCSGAGISQGARGEFKEGSREKINQLFQLMCPDLKEKNGI